MKPEAKASRAPAAAAGSARVPVQPGRTRSGHPPLAPVRTGRRGKSFSACSVRCRACSGPKCRAAYASKSAASVGWQTVASAPAPAPGQINHGPQAQHRRLPSGPAPGRPALVDAEARERLPPPHPAPRTRHPARTPRSAVHVHAPRIGRDHPRHARVPGRAGTTDGRERIRAQCTTARFDDRPPHGRPATATAGRPATRHNTQPGSPSRSWCKS